MTSSAAPASLNDGESGSGYPVEPLSPLRSRSFEIPRDKMPISELKHGGGFRAHFVLDQTSPSQGQTSTTRMQQRRSMSHLAQPTSRPTLSKRRSIGRSVSSFSLYNHFAGERFDGMAHTRQTPPMGEKAKGVDGELYTEEISEAAEDTPDQPTASVGKAMFMFLKAFIGSGVLFLPKAFESGGLVLSIILMTVIAAICLFAFLRLVRTQLLVGGSYGDMGGVLYGRVVRFMVLFFLCISQIGFVCSYFIFVSGNLVNVVDVLSACRAHLAQKYYIWMPLVVVIPLAFIRHIARLSPAAVVADVFILFGLVCVIYFTASELYTHGVGPQVRTFNLGNFGMMMATATFSFEGIGLVIPIIESMQKPERFPFVVTLGMVVVCVVYILIGSLSYLAYGDHIQAAVVYNFPPASNLTLAAQLLYSVAIVLTIPLMLFPAVRILEAGIFGWLQAHMKCGHHRWMRDIFSVAVCCTCAAVAFLIGGDNLDKFVSLVGSVACVPLCFIFPGLFHYKVAVSRLDRCLDLSLAAWGFGIMVFTLYETIDSFISPVSGVFPLTPFCPV